MCKGSCWLCGISLLGHFRKNASNSNCRIELAMNTLMRTMITLIATHRSPRST